MAVDLHAVLAPVVPVRETSGWRARTNSGTWAPRAVVWHHDASAAGPSNTWKFLVNNWATASAQLWVDTAGVWWLIGAGKAHHAGAGSGWGTIPAGGGNAYAYGIETDHTTGEGWPAALLDSLRRGTAALLTALGADPGNALCGHKEYAPGRKVDPDGLNMSAERAVVADLMRPSPPTPTPAPTFLPPVLAFP